VDRSPGNIDTAVIDGWRRPQRARAYRAGSAIRTDPAPAGFAVRVTRVTATVTWSSYHPAPGGNGAPGAGPVCGCTRPGTGDRSIVPPRQARCTQHGLSEVLDDGAVTQKRPGERCRGRAHSNGRWRTESGTRRTDSWIDALRARRPCKALSVRQIRMCVASRCNRAASP